MRLELTQVAFVVLALVQAGGLAVTLVARLVEGHAAQAAWHRAYVAALLMAGICTLSAAWFGPGPCVACGACLAVMVLGATWDPRLHKAQA